MSADDARVGLSETEREIAEVIWDVSRKDEGTISATGANIIAKAITPILAARDAERREAEHVCVPGPLCSAWPYSDDDAYRTIAAVGNPAERQENRDSWAVTMRTRPDVFEVEVARARRRFEGAVAHATRAHLAALPADPQGGAV